MDLATFVFALAPPLIAIVTALFASVSDAYVDRASRESALDFVKAHLGAEIRNAIRDLVVRVARGALLISNLITTAFSVGTGLFAAIYYLPHNYLLIFVAVVPFVLFILYIIKTMVQFGVTDLYIQKVRRLRANGPATFKVTYGQLIDRSLVGLNLVLMVVVTIVFILSAKA
jgi:hypothetical protein